MEISRGWELNKAGCEIIKKAQISYFIILGVMIVIISGVFLYEYLNKPSTEEPTIDLSAAPIKAYVESCLQKISTEAAAVIGEKGGYATLPNISADKHAYFFYENRSMMPSNENIESELAKYTGDEIFFCLGNFQAFNDLTIKQKRASVSASILKDKILFEMSLPLTITKKDKTFTLDKFNSEVDVRLGTMLDFARNFTQDQVDNPDSLCVSCLSRALEEKNLQAEFMPIDDGALVILTDTESKNYTFKFVNKYK